MAVVGGIGRQFCKVKEQFISSHWAQDGTTGGATLIWLSLGYILFYNFWWIVFHGFLDNVCILGVLL